MDEEDKEDNLQSNGNTVSSQKPTSAAHLPAEESEKHPGAAERPNSAHLVEEQTPSNDGEHATLEENARLNEEHKKAEPLRGTALWSTTSALVFAVFIVQLNNEIIATAIPAITNYFDSIADIGYYGSALLLANAATQPLAGRIYTHTSLKGSFLSFLFIFEIGNLICGLATSSKMLIVARAITGVGAAGIVNGCLTIIAHIAPIEKRPILVALIANVARVGVIFGPLLGGVLSEKVSWRWVFLINCPIGAAVMLAIFLIKLPEREDKHNLRHNLKGFLLALDLPGFAILVPCVVMLLLALEWGGVTYAWNSATIIGLFCGSAGALAVFVAWQAHVGNKGLIPLPMLRHRVVSLGFCLQMLQFGCLFIITFYLPLWFQSSKQASPISSGLMTLPSLISQIAAGLAAGWAVQRIGHITPFAMLGCVTTAVGSGLMTTFQPWTGANLWIGYQILTGSGRGLASQMSILAVQYSLPKDQVSLGTSLLTFAGTFGGAIFIAAGQTAFANLLIPAVAEFAPGVDPQRVIDAGATNLGNVVDEAHVYEIILAYNKALTRMFILAAAASAASLLFCVGWGDVDIKKKKINTEAAKTNADKG